MMSKHTSEEYPLVTGSGGYSDPENVGGALAVKRGSSLLSRIVRIFQGFKDAFRVPYINEHQTSAHDPLPLKPDQRTLDSMLSQRGQRYDGLLSRFNALGLDGNVDVSTARLVTRTRQFIDDVSSRASDHQSGRLPLTDKDLSTLESMVSSLEHQAKSKSVSS